MRFARAVFGVVFSKRVPKRQIGATIGADVRNKTERVGVSFERTQENVTNHLWANKNRRQQALSTVTQKNRK